MNRYLYFFIFITRDIFESILNYQKRL